MHKENSNETLFTNHNNRLSVKLLFEKTRKGDKANGNVIINGREERTVNRMEDFHEKMQEKVVVEPMICQQNNDFDTFLQNRYESGQK